jgi:hypothetical protein
MIGYDTITSSPGTPQTFTFRLQSTGAASSPPQMAFWQPFCFYFPAGTITQDELVRLAQSLRRGPVSATQAGDLAMLAHQQLQLGGGVRLNSASAQPTKGLYSIGDRTFKTTGTGGWTCTAAGGASSITRGNTTAYATGVWAKWSSGTTVVECTTSGTTAGSPPTAPTTVGQTVTDGSVVWTCRSLTQAVFRAGL